jgi:excisionase family DNA binding protein
MKRKYRRYRECKVYLVGEAAQILRVSAGVLYRAIKAGRVPVVRLGPGGTMRIPAVWIDAQVDPQVDLGETAM